MAPVPVCDWRDASAYAWLLDARRPAFAWEWLRRNAGYRAGWPCAWASAGLLAPVNPVDDARLARPIWSAARDGSVVQSVVGGCGDPFAIAALGELAVRVEDDGCEHWLISDGLHSLRFDLAGGSLVGRSVPLRWIIDGVVRAEAQLLTLRRLLIVMRTGRFGGALFARETRAARWILELRAADALAAGCSQRDIAEQLFGIDSRRWRVEAAPYRLRVQRLVSVARRKCRDAAYGPV